MGRDPVINEPFSIATVPGEYILAFNLGSRRFAPTLFATLLALAGIVIGIQLGMWQLTRADEKRELMAHFAAGQATTQTLSAANVDRLPRYQTITAQGRYDSRHQVLLDNMPSAHGLPGFRVLTPFQLESGQWVLVDRGWVPMGATRNDLPAIEVGEEPRTITGRLDDLPSPGLRLGQGAQGTSWPRVLNFPQHANLEQALQRGLAARIVLLDPAEPEGFERVWAFKAGFGPERHIGYAVQWFALAATALIIYLLLSFRTKRLS